MNTSGPGPSTIKGLFCFIPFVIVVHIFFHYDKVLFHLCLLSSVCQECLPFNKVNVKAHVYKEEKCLKFH